MGDVKRAQTSRYAGPAMILANMQPRELYWDGRSISSEEVKKSCANE
jgi:hypothetical protein